MLLLAPMIWKTPGGVQRYMQTICRILREHGENLSVVTLLDDGSDRPWDVEWKSVCCNGSKVKFCLRAFCCAQADASGVCIVGHVGPLPVAWILKRFKLIDRYALVLHGIEAWERLSWLDRLALRNATVIIATTNYTAREFCFHNRISPTSVAVVPLTSTLPFREVQRQRTGGRLNVLTISRLSHWDAYKGIDTLLTAVAKARSAGVNLRLDVVGDGDDRNRLEAITTSLQIRDLVSFHGSVADEEVQHLIAEAHIFAMPSKKEGFGIVFLEAMAAGLPCIGANHGGTPEVIEHGETGFLIEYGDSDALAFYLQTLAESPRLLERMSAAAQNRNREVFSLELMSARWKRLIQSLLIRRVPSVDDPIRVAGDLPSSAN